MKFIQRIIEGKKVTIYFSEEGLREQVRLVMETKNDELIDNYFLLVHKQQLRERADKAKQMSLEVSLDVGYQFEDEEANFEDQLIEQEEKAERKRQLYEAIKTLSADQKWLVKQIYVLQRTRTSVAQELHLDEGTIRYRLKKINEKIRKHIEGIAF